MQLTVLGCAGTFPGPASDCSAYLVEHDGFRLLVDAGYGAVGALQRHGDLLDLDAVLVSHLHADHCIDLVAYSYARFYHPAGIAPRLPVYGPPGTAARIEAAVASSHTDWLDRVYDWRELDGSPVEIGPFAISFVRTNHPIECWAPRIEAGGAVLAYTGDTDGRAPVRT
jgi:ribonuclease BN (tRNA processing enzyme)